MLYLPHPVFTFGQLYIVVSQVCSKEGLKIVILDKDENPTNKTCNIMYKIVYYNLFVPGYKHVRTFHVHMNG